MRRSDLVERPSLQAAAALPGPLATGVVDEDAAHGLGRRREEVVATLPFPGLVPADQPDVGLVHQSGGLDGLAGLLPRQPPGGELAEFVVDQRQQLLGRPGVAVLDRPRGCG